MKKKLAALDMRIQVGGALMGVLLLTFLLNMFLVSPQKAKATKLQAEIDAVNVQIAQRRADLKKAGNPPTIEVADLFKLARAMPDRADEPGMILTLSQVAREAGISFELIEPVTATSTTPVDPATGFQAQRIHLMFNGNFYGLSDFLYRLRSLVSVRDGKLAAEGRLFNTDTVSFKVDQDTFPQIAAELYVNAYVYAPAPPAAAAPTTTTPTEPADTGEATAPEGATAVGTAP